MTEYKIMRWDGVMFGNSITKMPMIYIKPDIDFLEFARANHFAVICEINGTGTIYDGKQIPGVVDKSCNVPNSRPNFFEETGYYVITLRATWNGYPDTNKLGTVVFKGLNGEITEKEYKESKKDNAPKAFISSSRKSSISITQILGIMIGLFAIIFLSAYIVKSLKTNLKTIE